VRKTTYKINFQEERACNKNNQGDDGEENPFDHYAKSNGRS